MSDVASGSSPPDDSLPTDYDLRRVPFETEERLQQARRAAAETNTRLHAQPNIGMPRDGESQISLASLLVMMAVVSILLAIGRLFPPAVFAGVCGLVAVLYPLFIAIVVREHAWEQFWQQLWWSLLIVYLLSIIMAMARAAPV